MTPLNLIFAAVAVAAVVMPVLSPSRKSSADYEGFVRSLEKSATLTNVSPSPDVVVFQVASDTCQAPGRLVMAGYGSRNPVRDIVDGMKPERQLYFSGDAVESFDEKGLWVSFLKDQISSKLGFKEDGPWSRRLLAFDPPSGCTQSLALQWNGTSDPELAASAR
jgi:hypothetical protein